MSIDAKINNEDASKKSLEENIEELVKWVEKYPKAQPSKNISEEILKEYAKTDEEYEAIVSEYEKIKRYYEYAKNSKNKNKLTKEQIKKCKEGNVGGVFGYSSHIEESAKKYRITEDEIYNIFCKYETFGKLKEAYKNGEIPYKDLAVVKDIIEDMSIIDVDFNPNRGYKRIYKAMWRSENR